MEKIKQMLLASDNKNENQRGSLLDMLTLNPRNLIDGHVFYNSTNDKVYVVMAASMRGSRAQLIKDVRSGNFVWQEVSSDENDTIKIKNDGDVLHHSKLIQYPDDIVLDEVDCIYEMTNGLSLGNVELKKKWKELFETRNKDPIELFETLMNKKFAPSYFEKVESKEKWVQNILIQVYELIFLDWISS